MKKNIQFLIANSLILFFMVVFMDWSIINGFILWFLWSSWATVTAIMYAVIWRESVDCRCLEKERKE